VVVRRGDGTVIVAGQSHDTASAYAADVLASEATRQALAHRSPTSLPPVPPWVHRLQQLDPARVVFAHDFAVWVP
jgi:N-acyl homoserine lactone hydrolase